MSKDRSSDRARTDAVELSFLEKIAARLPEDLEILQAMADLYTKTGRFEEGLEIDIKLSHQLPNDDLVWYNLGCSYALTGHADEAFESLTKAVELGYCDYDWIEDRSRPEPVARRPPFRVTPQLALYRLQ